MLTFILGLLIGLLLPEAIRKVRLILYPKGEQLTLPGVNEASLWLTLKKHRNKPKVINEERIAIDELNGDRKP